MTRGVGTPEDKTTTSEKKRLVYHSLQKKNPTKAHPNRRKQRTKIDQSKNDLRLLTKTKKYITD